MIWDLRPAEPASKPVSIEDQVACVKREIRMRERVYPRRVFDQKMQQAEADYELAAMRAVLQTLLPLVPPEAQKTLLL